jgi:hypothetical protein
MIIHFFKRPILAVLSPHDQGEARAHVQAWLGLSKDDVAAISQLQQDLMPDGFTSLALASAVVGIPLAIADIFFLGGMGTLALAGLGISGFGAAASGRDYSKSLSNLRTHVSERKEHLRARETHWEDCDREFP